MGQNLGDCYSTYFSRNGEENMKQYFFTYYDCNKHKEVQYDDYLVIPITNSEEEIRKFAASLVRKNIRDENDIISISTTPIFPVIVNKCKKKDIIFLGIIIYLNQHKQNLF